MVKFANFNLQKMYLNFEELPASARVWVYLADNDLAENSKTEIASFLKFGMETWAAHGEPLIGGFAFLENRFLIIGVDQQAHLPSGCSIDASTRWIKEIQTKFGIDFLSRAIVSKIGGDMKFHSVFQIKKLIENGDITEETLVYDQQISTKAELENGFLKPAKTVFERYFLEKA
jgi:hypothetical protein